MTIRDAIAKVSQYNNLVSKLDLDQNYLICQMRLSDDIYTWGTYSFKTYHQLERQLFNEYVDCLVNKIMASDKYEINKEFWIQVDDDFGSHHEVKVSIEVVEIY